VSWREIAQDQNVRLTEQMLDQQGQINRLEAVTTRAGELVARWRARGDERCADELEAALQPSGERADAV
jgi:hypothetical protein